MSASAGHNVFVYGTLMEDEVVRLLLKRVPASPPAVLDHFQRFSIKGRVYPAIVPVENKKITGKVLLNITDAELNVLDAFEDVEYERKIVEVLPDGSSECLHTYTYVWSNELDPDLFGDWNFEDWKQVHMDKYLHMCIDFMVEEEQLK